MAWKAGHCPVGQGGGVRAGRRAHGYGRGMPALGHQVNLKWVLRVAREADHCLKTGLTKAAAPTSCPYHVISTHPQTYVERSKQGLPGTEEEVRFPPWKEDLPFTAIERTPDTTNSTHLPGQ